ncbi:MAG TPA: hypothetical protein VF432_11725 [Thermoanaerobaculia bacterium]
MNKPIDLYPMMSDCEARIMAINTIASSVALHIRATCEKLKADHPGAASEAEALMEQVEFLEASLHLKR